MATQRVTSPECLVRTTGRISMLTRTHSPLPRQNPRRLSASVLFGARRPSSKAGRGAGGIPTRLGAETEPIISAALGPLNWGSGWRVRRAAPVARGAAIVQPSRRSAPCGLPSPARPPAARCRDRPHFARPASLHPEKWWRREPVGRRLLRPIRSVTLLQTARISA